MAQSNSIGWERWSPWLRYSLFVTLGFAAAAVAKLLRSEMTTLELAGTVVGTVIGLSILTQIKSKKV